MGYAFISYSTANQSMADSTKRLLEKNKIASWMAPNDIPVGKKYAEVINSAIKKCDCVILLLSDAAQNSPWVPKEIERAINYKKMIIPVKLEDMVLNDEFELYVSSDQIIAIKQLDESSLETQKLLKSVSDACGYSKNEVSAETEESESHSGKRPGLFKKKAGIIIAAVALTVALFFGLYGSLVTDNDSTCQKIPFVNLSNAENLMYPFRDLNGFSAKRNMFFMKNTKTQNLSSIDTSTGKLIHPNEEIALGETDFDSVWACSTEDSEIVYFLSNGRVKIYDIAEQKWKSENWIDLSLGQTESIPMYFIGIKNLKINIIDENDIFFMVFDYEKNGGCYSRIIRLTADGEIAETNFSELNITDIVCGFDPAIKASGAPILAWTLDGAPAIFDLLTGAMTEDDCEEIYESYMPYINKDIQTISSNGKYIIREKAYKRNENAADCTEITVWDLQTGENMFSKKLIGKYCVAFDKENRLLLYNDGTLRSIDLATQESEELLGPEFFLSNPLFGWIPHTMHYSQKLDLCIWDTLVSGEETVDLITITDLNGQVLYQCDDFWAPYDFFYTHTFVGDDFILHSFTSYGDNEITTIPLKVSYTKDKNGNIKLK